MARVKKVPGVARGRRRDHRVGRPSSSNGKPRRSRRVARLRSSRPRPPTSESDKLVAGPLRVARRPAPDLAVDKGIAEPGAPEGRPAGTGRDGHGAAPGAYRRASSSSRASTGGATHRRVRPSPTAQNWFGKQGELTRDPSSPRIRASRRTEIAPRVRAAVGSPAGRGEDRASRTRRTRPGRRQRRDRRLPHAGAAGVRRRRAARRRVHHLQHVLDHRRAAARASSRCCGRSGASRRQVLASRARPRRCVIGRRRLDPRRSSPGFAWRRASARCSTRSASACRVAGHASLDRAR